MCPCHQSVFDPVDAAEPVGGPATAAAAAAPARRRRRGLPRRRRPTSTGRSARSPGTKHERAGRRDGAPTRHRAPSGSSSATSTRSPAGSAPTRRRQGAAQGVPEPLLVPVGRGRAVQLRGPAGHRRSTSRSSSRARSSGSIYDGSYGPLQGAEVSAAYDSVMRISFDVKGGLLIRQMHHWAALVFVGAIALHMARGLLHRRLPPAPRDQLGRRRAAADPRPGRRVHRLLAARRPAVGHRAAHHRGDHPRHPVRRRAARPT